MDFVRLSALENRNITEAIFSPLKWSNSLDASVRIHTSEYVCVRLRNRGGGGHRIDQRGYGIDAPGLFLLTHQGQVNI